MLPIVGGLLRAGAKKLASSGIIRGTAGKLLGGAKTAVKSSLPGMAGASPTIAGKILRGGGAIAGAAATGHVVGAGLNAMFGGEKRRRRRINPTNPRALRRALSRIESFEKLVKRSFVVKEIKPRRSKSCR